MKRYNRRHPNFTVADAIATQGVALTMWKKILKPAAFRALQSRVTEDNAKAKTGFDVMYRTAEIDRVVTEEIILP
jgi:hypothetical protein